MLLRMRRILAAAALLLAVILGATLWMVQRQALSVKASQERSRRSIDERAQMQENRSAITPGFAEDAWIALLPVTRQKADHSGKLSGVEKADTAMADLQHKAQSQADWLVWAHISDFSLTKLLQSGPAHSGGSRQLMKDPDACVSAVMAALRARVLKAPLPECEKIQRASATEVPTL